MNSPPLNTIVLYPQPSMLRGRLVSPVVPAWPAKDPFDVADLIADAAPLLGDDTIVYVDAFVDDDATLEVVDCRIGHRGLIHLRLSGGADGMTPTVLLAITCKNGRQINRAVKVPIVSQGLRPVPALGALTYGGVALTYGGDPLVYPESPLTYSGDPLTYSGEPLTY